MKIMNLQLTKLYTEGEGGRGGEKEVERGERRRKKREEEKGGRRRNSRKRRRGKGKEGRGGKR